VNFLRKEKMINSGNHFGNLKIKNKYNPKEPNLKENTFARQNDPRPQNLKGLRGTF